MKKDVIKLTGVPETMLIPLRARYLESKRKNGIVYDPKTIEILDRIEYNFTGRREISAGSQFGISIRTEILDEQVCLFMAKHPEAVVVNLGCGLDTRFHRIDNGSVRWFDLDVPEAIELKKKFFDETERFRFIAQSVLNDSWLKILPTDKPLLFVAEGLLMYFREQEVKTLLQSIADTFPASEMLFEAMSPFIARNTEKHADVKNYNATFKWGIKTGAELKQWSQRINLLEEWYYFDRHKERCPFLFKLLSLIPAFRKAMKIVHINFCEKKAAIS